MTRTRKRKRTRKATRLPRAMSERTFQTQVLQLFRLLNWVTYHTYDSRKSAPGLPDIIAVKGKRLLFCELKTERGKTTAAQELWLSLLRGAGQEVYLWRPSDMNDIIRILREGP